MKPTFIDKLDKNQQAQDINSIEEINNNPVIDNDIIPEENKDIIEETISTSTTTDISTRMEYITEEETNPIEQNNTVEEIPQPTPQPAVKNTVRYIDSGFTF